MRKCLIKFNCLIALIFLMIISGCGLKANPIPYPLEVKESKPVIRNLEATSANENVVLKWNFLDRSGIIHHIKVERSDVGQNGNICKDCPQIFGVVGQVIVKDGKPAEGEKTLTFTDYNAVKGHIYNYRLMLCEENENCSESAATEINFK